MKLGIVGLPNVGKSTLFNAITSAKAEVANYPFCTIEPNTGVAFVPDERLDVLNEMYGAKKLTRTAIEFVDIAGLVEGASQGKGLGNRFLSHVREVDAIVHVVRCFVDDDVVHVGDGVYPARDVETINTELILSDLEVLERRIEKTAKHLKADAKYQKEFDFLQELRKFLNLGNAARSFVCSEEQADFLAASHLLSAKPVLFAANFSEDELRNGIDDNKYFKELCLIAKTENATVVPISAKLEEEISQLLEEEKKFFSQDTNSRESGLETLIKASYSALGLISFLTAGPQEVRAWPIRKGTSAQSAAGKIHSDMEKGFIKAEVINYSDLVACGGITKAKEKGLVRLEGKSYVIRDGDVVLFRFNV
ncbi:MAG: redox-regulated ATPase YchF [Oscillospiraceae bacterium]|nr:redox-regulated ATPase YchF [Oscillospiraceae bacterium]